MSETDNPARAAAEEICRRMYGWYQGDSAGSASALKYYDNTGRFLPGPASLIDYAERVIARHCAPQPEEPS